MPVIEPAERSAGSGGLRFRIAALHVAGRRLFGASPARTLDHAGLGV